MKNDNDHLNCRICKSPLRTSVLDLGLSPLSNGFVSPAHAHRYEPFYPLKVYLCNECFLVQVPNTVLAEDIFSQNYPYFSGYSSSWVAHCKAYAEKMIAELSLDERSLVIEIASNDGTLLKCFQDRKVATLGIEPTMSTARVAIEVSRVPTEVCFFGVETAERLRASNKMADLICGNNVLAHVPDLHDFVGGLPRLLKPEGVVTFEFPHLLELLDKNQIDTVYQEHFSYLSLSTAKKIMEMHQLRVFDVETLSTHGGSLRVYGCHEASRSHPTATRVGEMLQRETAFGLNGLPVYKRLQAQAEKIKCDFLEFLIDQKRLGKKVSGYGAPAKGNTLLNFCGVREDFIDYTVDRNAHKQGLLLPGSRIPVKAPEELEKTKPDFIVILPWNLKDEIVTQLDYARGWGAKFVTAIPELTVIS